MAISSSRNANPRIAGFGATTSHVLDWAKFARRIRENYFTRVQVNVLQSFVLAGKLEKISIRVKLLWQRWQRLFCSRFRLRKPFSQLITYFRSSYIRLNYIFIAWNRKLLQAHRSIQATVTILENLHIILEKTPREDVRREVLPVLYKAFESNSIQIQVIFCCNLLLGYCYE